MGQTIQWITHKGKSILLCDFSNFKEKEYLAGVDEMEIELLKRPKGSKVLHIVDVTDSVMSSVTSARGKLTVERLTQAGVSTTTAMVGIVGIKKIIAQAISRDVNFAIDIESAKEWLVNQ